MDQNSEFGTGARMILAALVSAVVTATLVIAVGQSLLDRAPVADSPSQPVLIRTAG